MGDARGIGRRDRLPSTEIVAVVRGRQGLQGPSAAVSTSGRPSGCSDITPLQMPSK